VTESDRAGSEARLVGAELEPPLDPLPPAVHEVDGCVHSID
jgi:hypothetical protein